jgi:hypothetical protein
MPFFTDPPLRDFPDRAHRLLLEHPANLPELVAAAAPDLAPGFVFERMSELERALPLPDWRRRESDLLFRVPWQAPAAPEQEALVCVLVEHQTQEDAGMPMRTLLMATLFWDRLWKAWEEGGGRGEPLRLRLVLPVVFHTGREPWAAPRTFADHFDIPEPFRPLIPTWRPVFFDLPAQPLEALRQAPGEWLRAMAVVRAERADADAYRDVLGETFRRLEPLSQNDWLRWHDLMWFLLSWFVRRRPGPEHGDLIAAATAAHENVAVRREVETVGQMVGKSWDEEMAERIEQKGREAALRASRDILRGVLEERFGPLPAPVVERIENCADLDRLKAEVRRAVRLKSPDEFSL